MVDPGQLPADPELHAVGVVDPDDLGGRGQAERNIKAVSLEQHLYTQRSSHEVRIIFFTESLNIQETALVAGLQVLEGVVKAEEFLLVLGRKLDELLDDEAVLDDLPGEDLPIKLDVLVSLQPDILQSLNLFFNLIRIDL